MVKIALIQPPLYNIVKEFSPPLGLAYIASYLKKFGYDCEILDANALRKDNAMIVKEVSGQFELIGITVVTLSLPIVTDLVGCLKKVDPKVKVVLGGIHPTVSYNTLLRMCPQINALVIGEGEQTFLEIIKLFEEDKQLFENKEKLSAIDGIAFRDTKTNEIIRTQERRLIKDLDTIPFPAFEKLPLERYMPPASRNIGTAKTKVGFMITARGCPFRCTFCASPTLWQTFRYRSAENIIEEIKFLIKEYNIRQIDFQDDTLTAIPERIEKICNFIIDSNIKIKWNGFSRVTDIKNKDLLKKMHRAGCYELQFGIESADQDILNRCNKKISIEDTTRAIDFCDEIGIRTLGYFIIGLPGETKDSASRTITFAKNLNLDLAAFYILLPYPGTLIYNDLISSGKVIEDVFMKEFAKDYSVFKNPVISVSNLSIKELKKIRNAAIKQFYFSRKFITRTIKHILKSPINIFPLIQILREFYYLGYEILFKEFKYFKRWKTKNLYP